ncbi:MAG: hypothetical protein MZV63_16955 [Marinilabiliales bacterium]|nr:hypothetical protein [Marinilabiliales bacterium]
MHYSYRIALESLTFGFVGNSQLASSIFLEVYETDEEIAPVFPAECSLDIMNIM